MTPLRALLDGRSGVLLMGVVNRTPDSFFDGGVMLDDGAALAAVDEMCSHGAAVIDVGAESTRPGAEPIWAADQIARLGHIVARIAERGVLVSIDTTLPEVAEHALAQGATIVNSVSLEAARPLAEVAARHDAALVLMHCRGAMAAMKGFSVYADDAYRDVVTEVAREWTAAALRALEVLPREALVLDPGLGFAKNARQSIELCGRLGELVALGYPVLVGPSRKSFLARIVAKKEGDALAPPAARLGGTIAACLACVDAGARMLRVHDVGAVAQALAIKNAISQAKQTSHAKTVAPHEPHVISGAPSRELGGGGRA